MNHDMNYYRLIHGTNGVDNMKQAKVRSFKYDVNKAFHKTINWEQVDVNHGARTQQLEIVPTNDLNIKKFTARPNEPIDLGDIIMWRDGYWLVETLDADNQINYQGTMQQCNTVLRWQLEDGSIYQEYGIFSDASKYSYGEQFSDWMDYPQFNIKIHIQVNPQTLKIPRNKRFLIVAYGEGRHPLAVEISRINVLTIMYAYNEGTQQYQKGVLQLTAHETQFNEQFDNAQLGIADYFTPQIVQDRQDAADIPVETGGWF